MRLESTETGAGFAVHLPQMLTPDEVRQALGGLVSIRTVQRMARARKIPGAVWIGRRLFFQRRPLLEWIEGGNVAQVFPMTRAG